MDNEIINASLRRSIKSGSEYDQYIPKSTCEVQSLGNGKNNTIEGVNFMADWVKQHSHQVKKLAKVLKKSSLQETVASIWHFAFYHFQYDADGELQKLRSPACSWSQRQSGIDCKSYTILICSLLREMNISSYIRQIKQPGYFENEFTHVYAIVPVDQDKTPNTSHYTLPYYVVDATVSDNKEPNFIDVKDKLMSGLPYQGMKGKVPGCNPRTAKLVTKASNAGKRLYKGKSSGGRDLAKWRHGSLKAPAQNSIITKLYKYEALIIQLGFSKSTFNAMLQYAYTLIENGISASQIKLFFEPNGFKIGVGNRQGMLFKHPYLSGQSYVNKLKDILRQKANNGLKSSNPTFENSSGGSGSSSGFLDDLLSDIDFGDLIDSVLSVIGGSSGFYKPQMVEANIEKLLNLYQNIISDFNSGIKTQNSSKTGEAVVRLKNTAKIVQQGFVSKKNADNWSGFTKGNLQVSADFANKLQNAINTALSAYINSFTTSVNISAQTIVFNQNDYSQTWNSGLNLSNMFGLGKDNPVTFTVTNSTGYLPKETVNVPEFELNTSIVDAIKNNQNVNTSQFLNTLTKIIVAVTNPGNPNNPTNPNNNGNTDQGTWNGIGQETKTSSLVWFGIALASGYVFRKPIMNALNLKTQK